MSVCVEWKCRLGWLVVVEDHRFVSQLQFRLRSFRMFRRRSHKYFETQTNTTSFVFVF